MTGVALPHSQESEMMVLGCMLSSLDNLSIAVESLNREDFYYSENQIIFDILKAAYCSDKPSDVHLVSEELKRMNKLQAVGGISYITALAQYAGTSTYIEHYIQLVRAKSIVRQMILSGKKIENRGLEDPGDVMNYIREAMDQLSIIEQRANLSRLPLITMEHRIESLDEKLSKLRGRKYLGLCQKTIQEIDDKLLGLRKLLLLAAAPNVGKTALTIQLVLDVLKTHEDACLVYFSLEMREMDIFTRMFCNLSQLDYRTFVLGSNPQDCLQDSGSYFKEEEKKAIQNARAILQRIGDRLQIIDSSQLSQLDARKAISFINDIKERTHTNRAIVVIDYLQVWPLQQNQKYAGDLECDKWRIEEMKKIRDAINDDPVIVISEARKPSGNESGWGGNLSDVMGSARATYTPDGVMLFSQLSLESIWEMLLGNQGPEDAKKVIENSLNEQGISICRLDFPKARDGMQRFSQYLKFYYRKNMFKATSAQALKIEFCYQKGDRR